MDYSGSMQKGELITELVSSEATPDGLTFDPAYTIDKQRMGVLVSGGSHGRSYKVRYIVGTDNNQILENEGELEVEEL